MAIHRDTPTLRFAVAFAIGAPVFLALDAVWLTTMGDRLYRPSIGHLMRAGFEPLAAIAFYVVYLAGSTVFTVLPANGWRSAAARGALFGLVAYATYDLTNQATLRDWPWHVTFADLAWGTLVTGISAAIARGGVQVVLRGRLT
ncbi:MAG TPA: DUF2177 family protein [Burkholderiales bacterium]|nr:DUF2177 family protein [Burkholderiales bacterium]